MRMSLGINNLIADIEAKRAVIEELVSQRDAAWAEVDQLKAQLKPYGHDAETCCCPNCCTLRSEREVYYSAGLHAAARFVERWMANRIRLDEDAGKDLAAKIKSIKLKRRTK